MIPKISNYKKILSRNYSLCDIIYDSIYTVFNIDGITIPYLETYVNPNFDAIKKLNVKNKVILDHNDMIISIYDDYIVLSKEEVICYFEIKQREVISHYCNPKYQRQGYLFYLFLWILGEYGSLNLNIDIDNNNFVRCINKMNIGIGYKLDTKHHFWYSDSIEISKLFFIENNIFNPSANLFTSSYKHWIP